MKNPENKSIIGRTIGSEGFARAARTPLATILLIGGLLLGPGAIIHAVDLIKHDKIQEGIWYAVAGTTEVAVAGALAYANLRSMARSRSFKNSQSPGQSNRQ